MLDVETVGGGRGREEGGVGAGVRRAEVGGRRRVYVVCGKIEGLDIFYMFWLVI